MRLPVAPLLVRLVVLGLALPALAACSSGATGPTALNYVGGDGNVVKVPSAQRRQPVALAGTTLEGTKLDVATWRGKVVVLNVWGSWCPPCRKEAPDLEKAYQQLHPSGVEFVGIDINEPDVAQAKAFQRTFSISYPSLADDGSLLLALRGAVAPSSVPSTLVLDGSGRVAARVSGAITFDTLIGLVADARPSATPS